MYLSEYFVELLDRDILINFPSGPPTHSILPIEIYGNVTISYTLSTLPSILRDLANIVEILENILSHMKDEIGNQYEIEFRSAIRDCEDNLNLQFAFNLNDKDKYGNIGLGKLISRILKKQ